MGPCLFSMEDDAEGNNPTGDRKMLQWGHAYSAWKTLSGAVHVLHQSQLQWGHAYSAWKTAVRLFGA